MVHAMKRLLGCALVVVVVTSIGGCKKDSDKAEATRPASTNTAKAKSSPEAAAAGCQKLCRMVGKCASRDEKCYAESDTACQASVGCSVAGACHVKDGLCSATSDADCEKSQLCTSKGACVAVNGRCVNSSPIPGASDAPPAASAK